MALILGLNISPKHEGAMFKKVKIRLNQMHCKYKPMISSYSCETAT